MPSQRPIRGLLSRTWLVTALLVMLSACAAENPNTFTLSNGDTFSLPDGWSAVSTEGDRYIRSQPNGWLNVTHDRGSFNLDQTSDEELRYWIAPQQPGVPDGAEQIDYVTIDGHRGVRSRRFLADGTQTEDVLTVLNGRGMFGGGWSTFSFIEPEGVTGAADHAFETLNLGVLKEKPGFPTILGLGIALWGLWALTGALGYRVGFSFTPWQWRASVWSVGRLVRAAALVAFGLLLMLNDLLFEA